MSRNICLKNSSGEKLSWLRVKYNSFDFLKCHWIDLWVFFNSAFAVTSVSKHQNILDRKFQILLSGPGLVKGIAAIYIECSFKKINAYDELLMVVLIKALVILVNLPLAFLRYCCKIFLAITIWIFFKCAFHRLAGMVSLPLYVGDLIQTFGNRQDLIWVKI